MIHEIEIGGDKFKVHSFAFVYKTDQKQGYPSEHGSTGSLILGVKEDGTDAKSGGKNFKTARDALWKRAVEAPFAKRDKLVEESKLFVRQQGGPDDRRKITFKGWVARFSEHGAHSGTGGEAGDTALEAELFVWARDKDGYTPVVG